MYEHVLYVHRRRNTVHFHVRGKQALTLSTDPFRQIGGHRDRVFPHKRDFEQSIRFFDEVCRRPTLQPLPEKS